LVLLHNAASNSTLNTAEMARQRPAPDENLPMSQASGQSDKQKFSSGVSQSQRGDELIEIVQYVVWLAEVCHSATSILPDWQLPGKMAEFLRSLAISGRIWATNSSHPKIVPDHIKQLQLKNTKSSILVCFSTVESSHGGLQ
jgi:hypothetical protein